MAARCQTTCTAEIRDRIRLMTFLYSKSPPTPCTSIYSPHEGQINRTQYLGSYNFYTKFFPLFCETCFASVDPNCCSNISSQLSALSRGYRRWWWINSEDGYARRLDLLSNAAPSRVDRIEGGAAARGSVETSATTCFQNLLDPITCQQEVASRQ